MVVVMAVIGGPLGVTVAVMIVVCVTRVVTIGLAGSAAVGTVVAGMVTHVTA